MSRFDELMNMLTDKERECFSNMARSPFFLITDIIKDIEKYLKQQDR